MLAEEINMLIKINICNLLFSFAAGNLIVYDFFKIIVVSVQIKIAVMISNQKTIYN